MFKQCTLFAIALLLSFASRGAGTLTGVWDPYYGTSALGCCVGGDGWVAGDSTVGPVTWSSSNPAVATVSGTSDYATVHGVSAGTTIISYVSGSSVLTGVFTVTATTPAAITGPTNPCQGVPTTLSCATPGGTWSILIAPSATITSSGVYTLFDYGGALVHYSIGPGCYSQLYVSTSSPSIDPITGPGLACIGTTITLAETTSGGAWATSNPAVGTIDAGGVVTGISPGTVVMIYSKVGTSCTAYVFDTISVAPTTAGTISGTLSVYVGTTAALTASMSSGTWSSSTPSVATISATGVVTGVAVGTSTISYTVAGCSGPIYATAVVTVNPLDGISGHINFGSFFPGSTKVWLIKYDPATLMLTAVDSQVVYTGGGSSAYYQFTGLATDSFRVKAKILTYTGYGYVPTYCTSSYYWSAANVIHHVSGTADLNKDINMIAGTTPTGPGFISGNVTTGANKGTSGGVPVVGLNMYLVEAATNTLVTYVQTDATGTYTFSGLPLNTYFVFPDSLNYATIPYSGILLTSASPSKTAANFTQRTISKVITPYTTGVNEISTQSSIAIYPNPTNGKLNISWQSLTDEAATVVITNVAGATVYQSSMHITAGAGNKQIELPALSNGSYLVQLKSANLNHSEKLQIER